MGFVYNPDNQDDQELRDRFVIRTKEFERIIRDLKSSVSNTSAQQYLLLGQRGTGKTSLLLRIRSEVLSDKALSHLLPVRFAEEQYGIFNLCGLWEKIAEELEEIEGFETLLDTLDDQSGETDYELQCFETLENYLIKQDKKLLLLMDNIGDVLNKFTLTEQQRLRDIFHNSSHIQLIAASASALEQTYQHDKPFYEFFKVMHLKGLNKEETYVLLRKLAEIHSVEDQINNILEHQQHRVESIRRLTGGVPRTIVLLYEIFVDESGSVFEDLESILDRVTPLYKHRMDDLPMQQQVIVNALALNWDGMSTKELTEKIKSKTFTSSKISSQLQQLQKSGLIHTKPIDKKNKIYFIQERFFNIWYLMRFGRKKNKQNVNWLVSFLREWCDTEELHQRAKNHIKLAREGRLHPKSYLMAESMGHLIYDRDLQHELILETRKSLRVKVNDINLKLSSSDKEIWEQAVSASEKNEFIKAIGFYKSLIKRNMVDAMFNLACLYHVDLKDFDNAILYYNMAAENGDLDAMFNLGNLYIKELEKIDQAVIHYKAAVEKSHLGAMNNLANLFQYELQDFEQAIRYYQMAIENNHAGAMNSLGHLFHYELKDFEQATKYYKMAIEKWNNVSSMYSLGLLYKTEMKDFEKATKYYKMAIENNDVDAMNSLGVLYNNELKDFEQAIKYYKMAIENDDVTAMRNLSYLYQSEFQDFEQALKYYKMAIEKDDIESINSLAFLYKNELKDFEQATKYFKMAIEKDHIGAMFNLGYLYQKELKNFDQAIHYYEMAIENDNVDAMHNLGYLYDEELKNSDQAIHYYNMAIAKNHAGAMNSLAWSYYTKGIMLSESLQLSRQAYKQDNNNPYIIHTYAVVSLWNNNLQDSLGKTREYLSFPDHYLNFLDDVSDYFILLLAKNHAQAAYELFKSTPDLEQQIKPVYYATLSLLKDQYPKEYLKMGSELQETVDEILQKVKEKAERYN